MPFLHYWLHQAARSWDSLHPSPHGVVVKLLEELAFFFFVFSILRVAELTGLTALGSRVKHGVSCDRSNTATHAVGTYQWSPCQRFPLSECTNRISFLHLAVCFHELVGILFSCCCCARFN